MLDYVAEELSAITGWRRVLEAYATLAVDPAANGPAGTPESSGWAPRLARLDGVEPERLSALHGKLIALGLLSFEVSGKSGMQYQLSPLGRRTLSRGLGLEEPLLEEAGESQSDAAEEL